MSELNRLKQNDEISPITLSNVVWVGEISLMQREGDLQQQTIGGVDKIDTAGLETLMGIEAGIENGKEREKKNEGELDKENDKMPKMKATGKNHES
ncbi:hypothetical protein WN944_003262 [Citrus x changshan-huyou]|uniref:Uncharacterized protein n=1 Tax=Citrus x changshan-huyou TaxID=2935761 RepID=A0AAP0QHT9_9ROSI